jgi:PadR family transcriptional regulator, regulatory protein AphA
MAMINKTRYALLGALSLGPMSGYDIKKFCDISIAHFWHENFAHIYPVLKDMEKEGLVVKKTEQNEGRPPKNIYSINEEGRKELDRWLLEPVEDRRPREELLLKIFFSVNVPVENLRAKLRDEKEKCLKYLEEYRQIEEHIKYREATRNDKSLPLWLATLNYGRLYRESIIKWCDQTMKELQAGQN